MMELNEALGLVLAHAGSTVEPLRVYLGLDPHLEEMQKEQEAAIERVGEFLQYRHECFDAVRGGK